MTPERWEKLKQIFGDALERAPTEREALVREAAKDDPELLSELLRLLEESDRDSKLLSQPALTRARPLEPDEGPRFAPDTVLARRFRIIRFIARGGMGEVYEAEDLELGERVALKAIRRNIAPDSELLALFKQEVQLARRVTHPNVCRIFDLEQHEDAGTTVMLLSMELLHGPTLSEHLRDTGSLSFRDALPLIEEIAAGLQAVHDAGIIHGDLKPANVMLASRLGEDRPRAVVMDFGMALPVTPDAPGHRVSRGGTPEYYAPEQARGAPVTTATDVYSFALMIADMLGAPRSARLKPDAQRMPFPWARSLRRCLESEPARRYSRPAELAATLRRSANYRRRTVIRVAAAALVAAVGIPAAIVLVGRMQTLHGTASRQILTEGSALMVQRPSPDGRFVAAVSWDTGDLILRGVNSGKTQRLTHNTAPGVESASTSAAIFSPDGRRIAYAWTTSRADGELRLVGTDGTGQRTLYRSSGLYPAPLDWSPDGTQLLVSLYDHNAHAQTALISTLDGSVQFPKIPEGPRVTNVVFSAGGDGFVFTLPKSDNTGAEIHRLSLSGVDSTLVTSTSNRDSIIGWSPDRRRLIFSSDRRGQKGIWAISVSAQGAEGKPQELVPDASRWDMLGITQTGALLYRMDADAVDVYTAVLDLAAGRTVSPPQLVMDRFVGSYAVPNWSGDGRRLVALSKHDPRQPAFLIYELQSGAKRELRVDLRQVARPQWVESGRAIMAQGEAHDGVDGLFRIDPSTGKASLFMTHTDLETVTEGVWSADGKFYFNRYSDNRRGIFRLNTQTRERRVLYVPPPAVDINLENLALSPDGRTLAFHARNDAARTAALMLLAVDGGEARTLLTIHQPEMFVFGSFTWTPDSRRVLASRTRDGISEIWQVPVDGRMPIKIDFPSMPVVCLRLNPDGKTIAFHSAETRSEIWMLQNFL
jgi:Tol biopolymer transport system component